MQPSGRTTLIILIVLVLSILTGCMTPKAYRERAMESYQRGNVQEAKADWINSLEGDPSHWQANYYLGEIALDEGEVDAARRHLEVAFAVIRDEPTKAQPVVDALAETLYRQGITPRLVGLLNEAIDQYGTTHDYLRKAEYLRKLGDPDAAAVTYRKAARMAEPDDPAPYLALADFYESIGRTDDALIALRRAYGITPNDEQLAQRIREYGLVPGPTVALPPDR